MKWQITSEPLRIMMHLNKFTCKKYLHAIQLLYFLLKIFSLTRKKKNNTKRDIICIKRFKFFISRSLSFLFYMRTEKKCFIFILECESRKCERDVTIKILLKMIAHFKFIKVHHYTKAVSWNDCFHEWQFPRINWFFKIYISILKAISQAAFHCLMKLHTHRRQKRENCFFAFCC